VTLHSVLSHTLGCEGRNNSEPSSGSSGHTGGTRSGQTRKKPKDLSVREREYITCSSRGNDPERETPGGFESALRNGGMSQAVS
jgi:hypothetical protein